MQARVSSFVSGLGLCALLLGGCAYGEVRQVVRAQFASDLDCPEVQLKKRELWYSYEGPDQFKAIGCGHVRTYTCPANSGLVSYDDPVCTFVEGDADAPKTVQMAPEGEEAGSPEVDDTSGGEDTGGGDVGGDSGSSGDDTGGGSSGSGGSSDDDLGGEGDVGGEASSSHGAAHGGAHAGGGVKVKIGGK